MRKNLTLFVIGIAFSFTAFSQQQWDQAMQLKNCSIDIKGDMFVMTTLLEAEFFNSSAVESEGLFRFHLNPGQVVTGFQLELNGKYRDGSIEEKWKATNSYNAIVGKRIDPALLTMDYAANYSLRIYPLPAKGSRRVKITIQQLAETSGANITYFLPIVTNDTLKTFNLSITVNHPGSFISGTGLIANKIFYSQGETSTLKWQVQNIKLNKPIAFNAATTSTPFYSTKRYNGNTYFAATLKPAVQEEYTIQPKSVTIFWDASGSANERNISKEISFLKKYLQYHEVNQLTIIPFNHEILDTGIFNPEDIAATRWEKYLEKIKYEGATNLGSITASPLPSEVCLLFSDGNNTYGTYTGKITGSLLYCVYTSPSTKLSILSWLTEGNGGKCIDLAKKSIAAAIVDCSTAFNWLTDVTSPKGKIITDQLVPLKINSHILLSGKYEPATDTICLHYGNRGNISYIEKIIVKDIEKTTSSSIERLNMLVNFENYIRKKSWSDVIDFGLKEKIVTPNTAYIVLERVEDYVRYNITPPAELEDECARLNYIKRDTRFERNRMQKKSNYEMLTAVVKRYNERLLKLDNTIRPVTLEPDEIDNRSQLNKDGTQSMQITNSSQSLEGKVAGLGIASSLDEVVVTAYSISTRKTLTSSITIVNQSTIFSSATSVENALQGRVAGLQVTSSAIPGSSVNVIIRGSTSLRGNGQPLYILDGIPINGNINDAVNVNDIAYITVLKDAAATSLYGSRAYNGAIVITTKKGKLNYSYNRNYRLKDMDDVDYIQEIRAVPLKEKMTAYINLRTEYEEEPGFFLDMANHFFENNLRNNAIGILMDAAEKSNGEEHVLMGIAYVLESFHEFKKAIDIYKDLSIRSSSKLAVYRNLAWAYYEAGFYQQAIDTMYAAINNEVYSIYDYDELYIKELMLYEMNAIIAAKDNLIDTHKIPQGLIRFVPVDLRFVADVNTNGINNLMVKEPKRRSNTTAEASSKNKGILTNENYWNSMNPPEYLIKEAIQGKYKVSVSYYDYYQHMQLPSVIRIRHFKNFGKSNQAIETENIMMNNQYGTIEISELMYP